MKNVAIARYRARPEGRYCLCGLPAIGHKRGGWVCARCDGLERAQRQLFAKFGGDHALASRRGGERLAELPQALRWVGVGMD